jgi:ArsR family transcriptional regulator, arsenate/arsenite/antimonite-responsive transcriptional repressor / arsenate reductase (thioredoxin)
VNTDRRAAIHAALGEPLRLAIVDQLLLGDASPGELTQQLDVASNLLAFHLGVLDDAGVVRRVRSEGDGRRQYVQLLLDDPIVAALTRPVPTDALTATLAAALDQTRRVVFVCTANSARSQLAAAAWGRVSSLPVSSAGTHPAEHVHPNAVATARRHGLDLTRATTADLTGIPASNEGTLLVAVCDNAHEELTRDGLPIAQGEGPASAGRRWLHWHVPDPVRAGTDDAFETAYAQITERVDRLAAVLTDLPRAS